MPVLVTGGAGYVGSHVARELLKRGERVVIVDVAPSPPPALSSHPGLEYVSGDIRDEDLINRIFAAHRIDSVVHFAALKSVAESMADPGAYFDNNVGGSLTLLQAMSRAGVQLLVFSSSCGVYGEPERLPVDESCLLRPANPYGESKVLVERMLGWFDQLAGIRYVSLRYFNAAGASDDAQLGERWQGAVNLIPVVIEAALGRGPAVRILGTDYPTHDGTAIRDYIHVLDLADAHLRALDHLRGGAPSDVLNIGTGVGASVNEVIAATALIAGHAVPTVVAPRRTGDPAAVWADSSRAQQVLGWKARRALPEIIESAWRWHTRGLEARPPATTGPSVQ
jgi:UDP-glucose 4-epimerase